MVVIDMDKPENCFECRLNDDYVIGNEYAERCLINDRKIEDVIEKPSWCPIIGEIKVDETGMIISADLQRKE